MKPYRLLPSLALMVSLAAAADLTSTDELIGLDKRRDHRILPASGQQKALSTLKAQVSNLTVDFDPFLGTPKWIRSPIDHLSGANGVGKAVTEKSLARYPADEHRALKAFLDDHRDLFGHGAEVLQGASKVRDFTDSRTGVRMTSWRQELNGISIYESILVSHLGKSGELMTLSSLFVPDPEGAANRGTPGRDKLIAKPLVRASQAISLAASAIGEPVTDIVALDERPAGAEQAQRFTVKPLPGTANARLIWFPEDRDTLRLCWEVELTRPRFKERFRVLVDVRTGEVELWRKLTVEFEPVTYRVFTNDSPTPMRPGWPTPNAAQPPAVSASLVQISALSSNASPLGWLNDGEIQLRGNNIDSRLDRDGDDRADLPRITASLDAQGRRIFDFPVSVSMQPTNYSSAASVQLFYWCNWMHDRLYDIGFVEAKGNFQKDNFGRGGLDSDPVVADSQDGSGVNNANFTPTHDGVPARIQMYIFTGPTPQHDGDLDAEVILHEYTHGMSDRRVGHGAGISQFQTFGLSEGWSDFFAEAMLTRYQDNLDANYPMGGYATYLMSGLQESYYYGIRRYPYTTRTNINPLMFQDIDNLQASSYPGIPRSPVANGAASEVHRQGEVWALMLWEARAALLRGMNVNETNYAAANDFIMRLIADGMDWCPPNPTFVQAREGIMSADRALTGGTNAAALWGAFAKRGLGLSAVAPDVTTTVGVVAARDMPSFPVLSVSPATLEYSANFGGTFVPASNSFVLVNQTFDAIAWSVSGVPPWLAIFPTNGVLPARGSTNVSVFTNDFNILPVGITNISLTFSSSASTNRTGVGVVVRVDPPVDNLIVNPSTEFAVGGPVGGPFVPSNQVFTLEASDIVPWYVTNVPNWLTLSLTKGTLGIGDTTNVTATVNSLANSFEAGVYSGTLKFVNSASGLSVSVPVTLRAGRDDFFVEDFSTHPFDLQFSTLMLTPSGGSYAACVSPATNFPVNPAAGNPLAGMGDDQYRFVSLTDGQTVSFFGNVTNGFWIGANGNVTLDPGLNTNSYFAGQFEFFSHVRIAPLFADLDPSAGGTIYFQQSTDRVVITWLNVPEFGTTDSNNAQLEIFYDGHIRITWLRIDLPQQSPFPPALAGLSRGNGLPIDFVESDLSAEHDCFPTARLLTPSVVREGATNVTGTLILSVPASNDMVVTLTCDNTNEIIVPAELLVHAGEISVSFPITVINDNLLDGTQTAIITAAVPDRAPASAGISILDNETTSLFVAVPAEASEGDGIIPDGGFILLGTTAGRDIAVHLTSSNSARLLVPATVVVPAGERTAYFDLTIIDDHLLNGDGDVTIAASVPGWQYDHDFITIHDNETNSLSLALVPQVSESGGNVPNAGVISLGGIAVSNVVVSFRSDHSNYIAAPSVIIPAGAASNTLAFAVINNSQLNQFDQVTFIATATNFLSATGSVVLIDDERPTPPINPDPANGGSHVPSAPLLAWNVNPAPQPPGSVTFDVYLGRDPQATNFLGSTTSMDFQVPSPLVNDTTFYWRVVARHDPFAATSSVWSFTTAGFDHFNVEPISSPQLVGQPFQVKVTARDEYDSPLLNFSGSARLTNAAPNKASSRIVITEVDTADLDNIEFQNVTDRPINIAGWQIVAYDWTSWPNPKIVFSIPGPSVSNPGDLFRLRTLVPRLAPGAYPNFIFSTNLFWNNNSTNNPVAVMLRDSFGNVVDFFCAADADPSQIVEPTTVGSQWIGTPVMVNLDSRLSYQRVGNLDHDTAVDWTVGAKTLLTNNVGLSVPFTNYTVARMSAPLVTPFINGTGTVGVTVFDEARGLLLTALDDQGHAGAGATVDVLAADDISVNLVVPDTVTVLDQYQTRLIVTNTGVDAATSVLVTNVPPPQSVFVSATASQGICALIGDAVVCDLGTLAGRSAASVVVVTAPTTPGFITNFAAIARGESDPYPQNNVAQAVTLAALTQISVNDVTNSEPFTAAPITMTFNVRLSVPSAAATAVGYSTGVGSATSGVDYTPVSGTLTFLPGITNLQITVPILNDDVSESNETVVVNLFSPVNGQITKSQGVGTIVDNDPNAQISASDFSVVESDTTNYVTFPVTLSVASAKIVTVGYSTADGTAVAWADYIPTYGTLVFPTGVRTQLVTVAVLGDRISEPTKSFAIVLANPGNSVIAKAQGVCTIVDDDTNELHHLAFESVPVSEFVNLPFLVQGSARDTSGRVYTNFAGPVRFTATENESVRQAGSNTIPWNFPLGAGFHDSRAQVIYLASELGEAGDITSLSLNVTNLPGQTLSNFTIRTKPYGPSQVAVPSWESGGWITNYQHDETIISTGWVTFTFRKPYFFDGVTNVLVDFSFNNSSYSADGLCRASTSTFARSLAARSDSAFGSPLNWTNAIASPGVYNLYPDTRFTIGGHMAVTPVTNVTVVDGFWRGMIALDAPGSNVTLRAVDDAGHAALYSGWRVILDGDGDGMADWWEIVHGFDRANPADGILDADGDGFTNLQEYLAGTDPYDASSNVRILSIIRTNANTRVFIKSEVGKQYLLEGTDVMPPFWQPLPGLPTPGTGANIVLGDATTNAHRFYRVRVK